MDELSPSVRTRALRGALAALGLGATCVACLATNFGVSPIRLDFDRTARTASVTVSNEDPTKLLQVQVDAFTWTQDEHGADKYEPTEELTFLPRIMSVQPAEHRLVRAGIRVPAVDREKAYRLFVQEIPQPSAGGAAAQVAVKVRFGIPVFAKPLKEDPRGEINRLELAKGKLTVGVANTGNVHFLIQGVDLASGDLYSKRISGWYLLPGAARTYTTEIPPEVCEKLQAVDVAVKTDILQLTRTLQVDKAACR